MEKITLDKVEEIGYQAFIGCIDLVNINLPEVKKIESGAFQNCLGLKSITLSIKCKMTDNRDHISEIFPFDSCSNVERITFTGTSENGILEIERNTFSELPKLQNITFKEPLQDINVALTAVNDQCLPTRVPKYWSTYINGKIINFSSLETTHSFISGTIHFIILAGDELEIKLSEKPEQFNLHTLLEKQYPDQLGQPNNNWKFFLPESIEGEGLDNLTREQLTTFLLSEHSEEPLQIYYSETSSPKGGGKPAKKGGGRKKKKNPSLKKQKQKQKQKQKKKNPSLKKKKKKTSRRN